MTVILASFLSQLLNRLSQGIHYKYVGGGHVPHAVRIDMSRTAEKQLINRPLMSFYDGFVLRAAAT